MTKNSGCDHENCVFSDACFENGTITIVGDTLFVKPESCSPVPAVNEEAR